MKQTEYDPKFLEIVATISSYYTDSKRARKLLLDCADKVGMGEFWNSLLEAEYEKYFRRKKTRTGHTLGSLEVALEGLIEKESGIRARSPSGNVGQSARLPGLDGGYATHDSSLADDPDTLNEVV